MSCLGLLTVACRMLHFTKMSHCASSSLCHSLCLSVDFDNLCIEGSAIPLSDVEAEAERVTDWTCSHTAS